MPLSKEILRSCVREVLRNEKYNVELYPGRGLAPGARLTIRKLGERDLAVAVRTSQVRQISLAPAANGGWRTISGTDMVIAAVPSQTSTDDVEILAFEPNWLVQVFDAMEIEKNVGNEARSTAPLFISLDAPLPSSLNAGTRVLAEHALWRRITRPPSQSALSSSELLLLLRNEIARTTGVDPNTITIEIKIAV
jgi:hypothetical protein